MVSASAFLSRARAAGFRLYTGVPCSYLQPFINFVIDDPDLEYVGAANEGDAVAIASGAAVAGLRSVVMFQNSGFGNAVNPLSSLSAIFRLPVLLIATWRGEPGGAPDEPQHELMGQILPRLFELLGIRWELFPDGEAAIQPALERAVGHMDATGLPFGLIMRKGSVASHPLGSRPETRPLSATPLAPSAWPDARPSRREVLSAVQRACRPTDAVVATTGFTGRALYALDDRPSQFYMVGSMGCAASFGLGIALAQPRRRAIVLDGDGAVLMRMGALATLGYERPPNLVHVLLDNEAHDSTGGQATTSHSVDLAAVAHACGYPHVHRAGTPAEVAAHVAQADGMTFIQVKTRLGESPDLPRPSVSPTEVRARFSEWLRATR